MFSDITVKETRSGKVAIILPRTPESMKLAQMLTAIPFGLPEANPVKTLLSAEAPEVETTEMREAAERRKSALQQSLPAPTALKTQKLVQYDGYDYLKLTNKQRKIADTLLDIHDEMRRYAEIIGKATDSSTLANLYPRFYRMLREEVEYYPGRVGTLPFLGRYVPNRLNTVLADGMGRELVRLIRREIRREESKMRPLH